MTMREAVDLVLVGRRAALRTGSTFILDQRRMSAFGFTPAETRRIEAAADEIEAATEAVLARVDGESTEQK
jgi:hypothetical protein